MAIFRDTANYYYKNGQKQAGAKETKQLTDKQFNELIDTPNVAGYTWEEYKGSEALRNAYEITREATQEIQQGNKPNVDNDLMQKQIENQINRKIKIKDNKISGNADLTTIGMDNQSIIWGIEEIDHDAKAKFIAVMDDRTTKMCTSLDGQIFNVHGWNEFIRYSETNGKEMKYRCYGLIQGLNLPPIDDHFHWCRSTIKYIGDIYKGKGKWYNNLGNSNKGGIGGSGKGLFIERISPEQIQEKLKEYEEQIRNKPIEYGILIDEDGNLFAYVGDEHNLSISDRSLDGVILTHNHPEIGSFGENDFNLLKENQGIKELRAVDKEYNYTLKILKPLDITYNEIYRDGLQLANDTNDEIQHSVMQILKERGYVEYDRTRKK